MNNTPHTHPSLKPTRHTDLKNITQDTIKLTKTLTKTLITKQKTLTNTPTIKKKK